MGASQRPFLVAVSTSSLSIVQCSTYLSASRPTGPQPFGSDLVDRLRVTPRIAAHASTKTRFRRLGETTLEHVWRRVRRQARREIPLEVEELGIGIGGLRVDAFEHEALAVGRKPRMPVCADGTDRPNLAAVAIEQHQPRRGQTFCLTINEHAALGGVKRGIAARMIFHAAGEDLRLATQLLGAIVETLREQRAVPDGEHITVGVDGARVVRHQPFGFAGIQAAEEHAAMLRIPAAHDEQETLAVWQELRPMMRILALAGINGRHSGQPLAVRPDAIDAIVARRKRRTSPLLQSPPLGEATSASVTGCSSPEQRNFLQLRLLEDSEKAAIGRPERTLLRYRSGNRQPHGRTERSHPQPLHAFDGAPENEEPSVRERRGQLPVFSGSWTS